LTRDYGERGRIGLGTPQANPTVEAEFARLIPPGFEVVTTRLFSPAASPRDRLTDYIEHLPDYLARFGGIPMDAFCFACTGSAYLVGRQREESIVQAAREAGQHVITATAAIRSQLNEWGARRILLAAPYPAWLLEAAQAYWGASGFELAGIHRIRTRSEEDTYSIYELTSQEALAALRSVDASGADVVLLSGTGMPTLPILAEAAALTGRPVVSSNLALARVALGRFGATPRE